MSETAFDLASIDRILDGYERRALSTEIALKQLVSSARDRETLRSIMRHVEAHGSSTVELVTLYEANVDGCEKYLAIRSIIAARLSAGSAGKTVEACRAMFDEMVDVSEEISVASFTLGSARALREGTLEVVEVLDRWIPLRADRSVLQIGCGTGRFEAELSARVASAHGIDISPKMIAAARRACAGMANVQFSEASASELPFAAGRFELVYAVDSMPFIVAAGEDVVDRCFAETSRVLVPGGDFVFFNYSYRGDDELDRAEVHRMSALHHLTVVREVERPFAIWNGVGYHLRKA